MRTPITFVLGLVAVAASGAVNAVTCYTLLDRSDRVVYQNSVPPVDMSDQGAAARDGLRRHNEYLLVSDFSTCPPVAGVPGSTGYHPATVDEIVGEMRGYLSYGGGSSGVSESLGSGSVGLPSAASPAASPAAPRASSPARGRY